MPPGMQLLGQAAVLLPPVAPTWGHLSGLLLRSTEHLICGHVDEAAHAAVGAARLQQHVGAVPAAARGVAGSAPCIYAGGGQSTFLQRRARSWERHGGADGSMGAACTRRRPPSPLSHVLSRVKASELK